MKISLGKIESLVSKVQTGSSILSFVKGIDPKSINPGSIESLTGSVEGKFTNMQSDLESQINQAVNEQDMDQLTKQLESGNFDPNSISMGNMDTVMGNLTNINFM